MPNTNTYDDTVPAEEPPPYTEIAEGGSVTIEQGTNMPRRAQAAAAPPRRNPSNSSSSSRPYSRPPPGPPPTQSHSSASSASSSSAFSRPAARPPSGPPPGPPPSSSSYRPPARPPPSRTNQSSSSSHSSAGPRPSKTQPPRTYYETLDDGTHRAKPSSGTGGRLSGHNNYATMPAATGTIPYRNQRRPDKHLRYPPNYYCPKCGNTGIKIKKGTPCTDCYRQFGVPNPVQTIPSNFAPAFSAPPRVLPPGHPGIGGKLCGRCRGSGIVSELLLFESTCPMCHGVGRVF